jgi:hypothetical protein
MDDLEIVQSEHASGHDGYKEENGENRRTASSPPAHTNFTEGRGWRDVLVGIKGVGFFLEPVIPEIQFRHDNFLLLL